MNELRPIGTKFEIEFKPDVFSTDELFWKVYIYQVKNHVKVARFTGDEIGTFAEEITPIEVKKYHARQRWFPGGQFIWEKGELVEP
jgi:hypothetical protein